MKNKTPVVTSLPRSPTDDRNSRMANYYLAMFIRMVCIVLCIIVPGWWVLIPAFGAVVLPYIAVVLANVGNGRTAGTPIRPGGLLPTSAGEQRGDGEDER